MDQNCGCPNTLVGQSISRHLNTNLRFVRTQLLDPSNDQIIQFNTNKFWRLYCIILLQGKSIGICVTSGS